MGEVGVAADRGQRRGRSVCGGAWLDLAALLAIVLSLGSIPGCSDGDGSDGSGSGSDAGGAAEVGGGGGGGAGATFAVIANEQGCPVAQGPFGLDGAPLPASLAKSCVVEGDLHIIGTPSSTPDDAWLAPLLNIRHITGSLIIEDTGVTHLDALGRLREIDGDLILQGNHNLATAKGLAALERIGHDLVVDENSTLKALHTPLLKVVAHGVVIRHNPALESLAGLDRVETVTEAVRIIDNASLVDLSGLEALRDAGGQGLVVAENLRLATVVALAALQKSGIMLEIRANPDLTKISGLQQLRMATVLRIANNAGLLGVDGFSKLDQVQRIEITDNLKLESVQGMSGVQKPTRLEVRGNAALAKLAAFGGATEAAEVAVVDNDTLGQLAFAKLARIGKLELHGNKVLGSMAGFFPTKYVDVLSICDNPQLQQHKIDTFLSQLYKPPLKVDDCKAP